MEQKFALRLIKTIILASIVFLIDGCGYFEKDKTEYQKNIVGNIKIQKQENSNAHNLVFAETDEIYSIIVEDCKNIFYDTTNHNIFVESFINESNSSYYQINILDTSNKSISNAIKKEKIEKVDFNKIRKDKLVKWELPRLEQK